MLLTTMFLTAIIETIFLWWCNFRKVLALVYFFGLNLLSNCAANIVYAQLIQTTPKLFLMVAIEICVILFETAMLGLLTGYSKKMFTCVLLSNLFAFFVGLIVFAI